MKGCLSASETFGPEWHISDLRFPDFNEHVHTHIEILVEIDGTRIPLELVGAGALQAIQLIAYATMYDPGLLLLDEPDAHLHPSNQRLLAATLLKIAEQGSAKIILATHSRHIFDALTRSSMTDVVWLKEGVKQERKELEDLSILLDLGASDSYELLLGTGVESLCLRRTAREIDCEPSWKRTALCGTNTCRKGEQNQHRNTHLAEIVALPPMSWTLKRSEQLTPTLPN